MYLYSTNRWDFAHGHFDCLHCFTDCPPSVAHLKLTLSHSITSALYGTSSKHKKKKPWTCVTRGRWLAKGEFTPGSNLADMWVNSFYKNTKSLLHGSRLCASVQNVKVLHNIHLLLLKMTEKAFIFKVVFGQRQLWFCWTAIPNKVCFSLVHFQCRFIYDYFCQFQVVSVTIAGF